MMRQEQTRQNKQTNKPKERRNDLWHVTCEMVKTTLEDTLPTEYVFILLIKTLGKHN